eukprot:CAMPEP_0201506646 /NCGR_PEP_ID=MMETSP0161_2-20130828/540_1 /ASSEMBLY_ACC=CAM_ASM_000251 /TAXON_ID=180227 /ORGANISM="Neoparamoeba aestuarina, Strain SoJaBio B1-5/56/2" /LENGTH=184 /DNA_ID=CAMNT_0047900807 /DNA_START=50 /DNA_END=604 /DNA_ORIENTATION=+
MKSLFFVALFAAVVISQDMDCGLQKTYPGFDLTQYIGQWYTIGNARLARVTFEHDLSCEAANYTLAGDVVLVNNTGTEPDGTFKEADGKAYQTNPNDPGALTVFFGGPEPKNPNYFVLNVSYEDWSLVGGPCKEWLWILSRTPQMDNSTYNMLTSQATDQFGYNLKQIGFEHLDTDGCQSLPPA